MRQGIITCSLKEFMKDIVEFVYKLIRSRFSIFLNLDANENTRKGKIQYTFVAIGLIEISQLFSGDPPLATFYKGIH